MLPVGCAWYSSTVVTSHALGFSRVKTLTETNNLAVCGSKPLSFYAPPRYAILFYLILSYSFLSTFQADYSAPSVAWSAAHHIFLSFCTCHGLVCCRTRSRERRERGGGSAVSHLICHVVAAAAPRDHSYHAT
jgi:hypothetical protein